MSDIRDQVPITPPPPNPMAKPQGESVLSKIGGGFSWWIGSLTGHPKAKKATPKQESAPQQSPAQQTPTAQGAPTQPAQGAPAADVSTSNDSVSGDIEQLKKLVGKFSTNINKSVGPVVQKGLQTSGKKASAFGKSNQKFLRTVLKIFFIVILIIIVAFIGMQFFKKLPGGGGGGEATPTSEESKLTVTPTPIVYNPTKPSIYADDPVVLKLEQDIDLLVREISGTNIKETQLNPPVLDYSISF